MRILAIDPGFERLGVAVLERVEGVDTLLFSTCVTTDSKKPFEDRLAIIGEEVKKVIKKWKPDALSIETLLFNNNRKTAMRVAEARGVVLYVARTGGLCVYEFSPLQIKIAIAGYGRATKSQVEEMTRRLIAVNKKSTYDDEIDAIAIGLTATASVSSRYPQRPY